MATHLDLERSGLACRKPIRRREFITPLDAAAAWSPTVRAQQAHGVKRVGWLLPSR